MGDSTERPLAEMAPHLYFEDRRFLNAAAENARIPDGELAGMVRESYLLHFRNLLEFFYRKTPQADDAVVSHYVTPEVWTPKPPDWYDEYRIRCNKLLAHPTYSRVEYVEAGNMVWQLRDKTEFLRQVWSDFMKALPEERRAWFR